SLARRTFLERRSDPGTGARCAADAIQPAWESEGSPGTLYRGCSKWRADRVHLPAERKSPTWSEVRLQTRMVRMLNRARRGTHEGGRTCRPGRRLQRRANCAGHLSNTVAR